MVFLEMLHHPPVGQIFRNGQINPIRERGIAVGSSLNGHGLPSRGTRSLVNPWARRLIFTHKLQHARLEIPMNLHDLRAFSPPRPASGTAD